ncbi:MAG: hypothetical protein ACO1RT_07785 [Planctomycetaceae bacterium]
MRHATYPVRWCLCTIVIASIVATAGCDNQLRTEYGRSRGVSGDQSINGFGVLRRSYESEGWSSREVNRLNERLANVDALVWLPQYRDTFNDTARQWFDQWLREKPRTLVYLVPDDGCETRYLEIARQVAPKNQRLAYRRRLARLETDQLIRRLGEDATVDNGWFAVERLPDATPIGGSGSEWQLPRRMSRSATASQPDFGQPTVDYQVIASPIGQASSSSGPATPNTPVPPTSRLPGSSGSGSALPISDLKHASLLSASDGSPVVVRLTAAQWGDSKVIVVGGGSLLSNFAMTASPSQQIASHLIAESGTAPGVVGFMTTDYRGAVVSQVNPEINRQTGMELLTVWPLSLIVLHLAVMGFIVCMILLPIFGRPREHEAAPASDFSDHLDAVASLMIKSGGEVYARRRVSDYMRRVRGETSGPWILPESKPETAVAIPPSSVDPLSAEPALPLTKDAP